MNALLSERTECKALFAGARSSDQLYLLDEDTLQALAGVYADLAPLAATRTLEFLAGGVTRTVQVRALRTFALPCIEHCEGVALAALGA